MSKKLKVLVIGNGGREHALVWKISQSKKVARIFCAPGNAGTAMLAQNIDIRANDLPNILAFAIKEHIDLTVVGPEQPLIAGITDVFRQHGLAIIGPDKEGAKLEGSKIFAKKFMDKYGIPTAKYRSFFDYKIAASYLKSMQFPLVIKAEGQCLGKGVRVCRTQNEALEFLKNIFIDKIFGKEGKEIIIEDCLVGQEASFMAFLDGKCYLSLLASQDHKRIADGDLGPNTGGMGAYAPVPFINRRLIKQIEKQILMPTLKGLINERINYQGIIYPGLILTRKGPFVLEYNCRFGDPETQAVLSLLKTDIIDIFQAILNSRLDKIKVVWHKGAAVCVVLASAGYPSSYEKGFTISGCNKKPTNRLQIFHSGTRQEGGKIITNGGRVLGITAKANNLKQAIRSAYHLISNNKVNFKGMQYRHDIGKKGLIRDLWH